MLLDQVRVKLISPDLPARFRYMNANGMIIQNLIQADYITATFTISRKHYPALKQYLTGKGDAVTPVASWGVGFLLSRVLKRPVLAAAVTLLLFLTLWLPTKVLFIRVEGNVTVPHCQILQCAENAGIYFGAGTRPLRSERVKNSLLQQIPELSWVGVNTKGCVATISVTERQIAHLSEKEEGLASSIVACRDGQITDITVTAGNALCKTGDIVTKGQLLISGYTDCGIKIQATHAKGEVFGTTKYENTLIFPLKYGAKAAPIGKSANIFLQIGKKEIKLWKGSGISGAICDKMYASYYLTLPGGFRLPFGLVVEKRVYYRSGCVTIPAEQAQAIMQEQSRLYLLDSMISGQILSQTQAFSQEGGAYQLFGRYSCREMLGRIHYEQIGAYHEQNNRKNRQRR